MRSADIPAFLRPVVRWLGARFLRKQRVTSCPRCHEKFALPPVMTDRLWEERIDCIHCGHALSLLEVLQFTKSRLEEQVNEGATHIEQPANLRIRTEHSADKQVWNIPRKGGVNFLMFFGTFWLAICSFFNYAAFFGQIQGDFPSWALFLFIGVFDLIGIGTLFAGLRMAYSRHRLALSAVQLVHERHFLGHVSWKSIHPAHITSIELEVFYTENYEPVYGLEICGDGQKIRFGSELSPEEKAWLCQELRIALGLQSGSLHHDDEASPHDTSAAPARHEGGDFEHTFPAEIGLRKMRWPALIVSGVLIFVISKNFPSLKDAVTSGHTFGLVVEGLFSLIPLALLMVSLSIFWAAVSTSPVTQTLRVSGGRVTLQAQRGHEVTEEGWDAQDVADVRIGHGFAWIQNGQPKSTTHLFLALPERVACLGWSMSLAELESVAAHLRHAVGLPEMEPAHDED